MDSTEIENSAQAKDYSQRAFQSVIPPWAAEKAAHLVRNFGFNQAVLEGAIAAALHTEREGAKNGR